MHSACYWFFPFIIWLRFGANVFQILTNDSKMVLLHFVSCSNIFNLQKLHFNLNMWVFSRVFSSIHNSMNSTIQIYTKITCKMLYVYLNRKSPKNISFRRTNDALTYLQIPLLFSFLPSVCVWVWRSQNVKSSTHMQSYSVHVASRSH